MFERVVSEAKDQLGNGIVKRLLSRHRPGKLPNVFLFATPRGGSSWLMEMIWSQPGFKVCDEPLDLRHPLVSKYLGISDWKQLYDRSSQRAMEEYFAKICDGSLRTREPLPGRARYYRYATSRIVFKIIHGAEDRIDWLARRFNGRAVLLLRHPIPVSLSRRQLPRLDAYLSSDYRRHFSSEELRVAYEVVRSGSPLEKGVLDWCLQNAVPLRRRSDDLLIVTYEQLVTDPENVLPVLERELQLPRPDLMRQRLTVASKVTNQSDPETRKLLDEQALAARRKLVERWRERVGPEEERRAMRLLELFNIDVYEAGEVLPNRFRLEPRQVGGSEPTPRLAPA